MYAKTLENSIVGTIVATDRPTDRPTDIINYLADPASLQILRANKLNTIEDIDFL